MSFVILAFHDVRLLALRIIHRLRCECRFWPYYCLRMLPRVYATWFLFAQVTDLNPGFVTTDPTGTVKTSIVVLYEDSNTGETMPQLAPQQLLCWVAAEVFCFLKVGLA